MLPPLSPNLGADLSGKAVLSGCLDQYIIFVFLFLLSTSCNGKATFSDRISSYLFVKVQFLYSADKSTVFTFITMEYS